MKPTPARPFETSPALRRRHRRRRLVQYGLVCIGGLLLLDTVVGEDGLLERAQARREYQRIERTLEVLRHENARLRDETDRLREDPAAIEETARRELGLIRPGEQLFILRDVPAAGEPRDD